MFEATLRYPVSGDDAVKTLAIGGLLSLLGVLIVPMVLVYGYLVRVVRDVSRGQAEHPPPFERWGDLLTDGLKALLIALAYTLVPAVLLTVATAPVFLISGVSVDTTQSGGDLLTGVMLVVMFVTGLVALLALVAAVYLIPVAVAAFATTDRLGAAFSPTELRRIGWRRRFLTGWLVAVVVLLLVGFVTGIAGATVIGLLLVPFLNFYGAVAGAYAVGWGTEREPAIGRDTAV